MAKSQIKVGAVLSYFLVVLNAIYGIFLTPYIVGKLGNVEYGVYKTVSSLSASLLVLDLGLGGTVTRFIAKYKAKKEDEKIPNFIAMTFIQAAMMFAVVGLVSAVLYRTIDVAYKNSLNAEQLILAKRLFLVLIVNIGLHIFENVICGIITGHNRFIFSNSLKICRLIIRVILLVVCLNIYKSAITIVFVDLSIILLFIFAELLFIKSALNVKIKYSHWDKSVFLDAGKYTILMFLISIVSQFNGNLDNVVIGAISGPTFVTVYSMGLIIFNMYENLSVSISSVMLPTITNALEQENARDLVVNLVIRAGRIQFMLLGAAVAGFVCVGKSFVYAWLGDGFDDVYIITLILMIPSLFELCVNVCISILRAKNLLGFRTAVLTSTTAVNGVVTYLLVKNWSYIGAAIGTGISFLLGCVIIMNIYYYKKLGLPMLRIYKSIFERTWICILLSGIGCFFVSKINLSNSVSLALSVMVFLIIYATTLLTFGFEKSEKDEIIKIFRRNY